MRTSRLLQEQQTFFEEGITRELEFRKTQLHKLRKMLVDHEKDLCNAVYRDLNKPEMEAVGGEILPVLNEIDFHLKKLDGWIKPEQVRSNLLSIPSKNEVRRVPYGVSLIIGAWNYPIHLVLMPLVGSISGGNCAILKPSEHAPATSAQLRKLISSIFDRHYISVVEGGLDVGRELLDLSFDKIFFTGSTRVGKIVMEKAAQKLIPVTLELGGKSPAVVNKDANIKVAARRITWGKYMNAGQICISPDFALVHHDVKDEFLKESKKAIKKYYGKNPKESKDYGRIINQQHFQRLANLLTDVSILYGGGMDESQKFIEPTIVEGVDWDHPIMKEEIFGPIMPILSYGDQPSPAALLHSISSPLALYIFSEDDQFAEQLITKYSHGMTCINDVIMPITNPNLPYGGTGQSGLGQYHGKYSFECFTRPHAIMRRNPWPDPSFRYPPYKAKLFLLKKLFIRK